MRAGGAIGPVLRAGARRHRLQTIVVGLVVFASTAMVVLGIGLLVAANAPFDRAFADQRGAHAVVGFDARKVTAADLAATAHRPGVAAAAGPYPVTTVSSFLAGRLRLPELTVVGRADPLGAVDVVHLTSGRWVRQPGEIVVSRDLAGLVRVGGTLTAGAQTLTVVGLANSVTDTADAWVGPDDVAALRQVQGGDGAPAEQMLYRFDAADDETAVAAGIAAVTAGLPDSAVLGAGSYLTYRVAANQTAATATPFVVAFALLGIVISVLIVANVVSGAVVAGYRGIGVLKAIGFTPAQVVTVHAGRMLGPGAVGGLAGVVVGNLLALPVLNEEARAYDVSVAAVPWWASVVAIGALLLIVGAAAVLPAVRAGRLAATQAIALGRAPQANRGRWARRFLARTPLPATVSLGLATPFARPARAAGALVAIALGATTLVLATGLTTSLAAVADGLNRSSAAPVRVEIADRKGGQPPGGTGGPGGPGGPGGTGGPSRAVSAATVASLLRDRPGTARVTDVLQLDATVFGVAKPVRVIGYAADSAWTGYPVIAGRWLGAADEAVVPTHLLRAAGKRVGDDLTLRAAGQQVTVHIVGEVFHLDDDGLQVITGGAVVRALDPQAGPTGYEVSLVTGTDADDYVADLNEALNEALPEGAFAWHEGAQDDTLTLFLGLIITLTLLVVAVAALGVFNTALLNTREQTRQLGILKSIGMTPRQVRVLVVVSLAGLGAVTGALAVPLGLVTHRQVVEAMARAAVTGLPSEFLNVFGPAGLAVLAGAGLAIAVVGALIPAGWAARSRPAAALRSE